MKAGRLEPAASLARSCAASGCLIWSRIAWARSQSARAAAGSPASWYALPRLASVSACR
jgi:hypothetical protein